MKKINFIFFGTPSIASQTLDILKENGYTPSIIVTSPDKPAGRGLILTPSPVSIWAKNNNILCLKPEKIDEEFYSQISIYPTLINIVVAYGKILPEKLINIPQLGTINIHYSLLPKYRGASPLESALLNGDSTTGISIQQMVFKLDSGPILATKEIDIKTNETKENLKNTLVKIGGDLLCEILPQIINQKIIPKKQNENNATYCTKINKDDGEINQKDNSIKTYNKYRAFYGWPGIFFFSQKNNKKIRVKIKEAIFDDNKFIIKRITPEGKKEINYDEFLKQN